MTGILSMTANDFNCLISGFVGGKGFTKLVEPIPHKKDSISLELCDNWSGATRPCNKPSPGKYVVCGTP